ncbi:hypothetical protein ACIF70_42855 [Actinacidiphila glaucinigra]|uniref:hypothetical protein n=1 Tax=Actinacidiphila glaucinigra TaxID=235986 RepID=UPI0037CAD286
MFQGLLVAGSGLLRGVGSGVGQLTGLDAFLLRHCDVPVGQCDRSGVLTAPLQPRAGLVQLFQ